MIDLHKRVCELDAERHRLQRRINAAMELLHGMCERQQDYDGSTYITVNDHAYYDNYFLDDLFRALETDQ